MDVVDTKISSGSLELQIEKINKLDFWKNAISSVSEITIILNSERRILFVSNALLEMMGLPTEEDILGLRPGEGMGCIHAHEAPGGCGDSEACQYCGAVKAVYKSQQTGERVVDDIRLTLSNGGSELALDLEITAQTILFEGETFTIVNFGNIEDKKRKETLERLFYHDLMNRVGGLAGAIRLLKEFGSDTSASLPIGREELVGIIDEGLNSVVEMVNSQKLISMAERNELPVDYEIKALNDFIENIVRSFSVHEVAKGKALNLVLETDSDVLLHTDFTLLTRVLENLLKNAAEASDVGKDVKLMAKMVGDKIRISVMNESIMPDEVRHQVFQRNYSTKGKGRGLGTYSAKLFTERYLGGTVHFESNGTDGTIFYIELPLQLEVIHT